jgi:multidrug efflux pump subunit AcrA (membrane-fusion protein)
VGSHWRLDFVSNQETIDQRSELVVRLCGLAARLPAGDQPAALSLDVREQAETWAEVLEPLGARQVAYAFFQPHHHEGKTGLIVLERHLANAPFTPVALRQLSWARQQLSRALLAATTHREVPFRRVLHPVTRARGMWKRRQRLRLAAWIGLPVALLALWLFVPWTLHVDGDCTVEPQQEVTVAAETSGKIERVLVDEGQYVDKGELLAKLEDEDLRTQMAVTIQDVSKWQSEANRYQAAGDDAQRRVSEINLLSSQARLDRLRFLQSRTELRAPIDGVILTKNLANRVGEAMETGKSFCEIAGRDLYEVQIDLRDQDLGVLLDALHRSGELPVDFILHAQTALRLHTMIRGTKSISETTHVKPGGSFFQVRADFPVDNALAASLKPGYTGKAKIDLGRHRLAEVMMRKFLDYWRVEWSF